MSLGGIPAFSLHRALRRAVQADVIVLAAAGNCEGTVVWPARYDNCIAVVRDAPWRGSCHGAAVDISAPGVLGLNTDLEPEHSVITPGLQRPLKTAIALEAR
jgi:subtilisin family serine protease